MDKVLVLGSGMVARPLIRYLLDKGFQLTIASNTPDRAEAMIDGHPRALSLCWEATDKAKLNELVASNQVTVSLLPWTMHLMVAEYCLKHRKHLVTTSYVKPEMKVLDQAVKNAGLIFLNEAGLDPGIDHMSAKRIIDGIHERGGAVLEFYSICGALPAPEAADNPFHYKFSWSPKGVIMAGNNDATYLRHGNIVRVPSSNLFKNPMKIEFPRLGILEVYPNRDSLAYREVYGIPETRTLYRGTFRYEGWCEIMDYMKHLNLLSSEEIDMTGMTYADLINRQLSVSGSQFETHQPSRHDNTTAPLHHGATSLRHHAISWLGFFDNIPMNRTIDSPFEVTSNLMISKMTIRPEERDMVVMQHTFIAAYSDGHKEVVRSRMLDFGIPGGDTAIARTVALPAAIAVEMILKGEIINPGVHIPVIPEIYTPILVQLENMGIKMEEEFGLPLSEIIA